MIRLISAHFQDFRSWLVVRPGTIEEPAASYQLVYHSTGAMVPEAHQKSRQARCHPWWLKKKHWWNGEVSTSTTLSYIIRSFNQLSVWKHGINWKKPSESACMFGTGCLVESSLTVTKKGLTDEVISRAVSMLSDFVICFDILVPLNVYYCT